MMFEWYSILANTREPARVHALANVSAERLMPLPCGPPISQLTSCPLIVPSHSTSYSPSVDYVSHPRTRLPIGGQLQGTVQYLGLTPAWRRSQPAPPQRRLPWGAVCA